MIPYDDLVVALTSWRARQGLPTSQLAGAPAPAPKAAPTPAPAPAPVARSGPSARAASPVALTHDDFEVDDDPSLLEVGSDEGGYPGFGGGESGEATAIGTPPAPPRRGGR